MNVNLGNHKVGMTLHQLWFYTIISSLLKDTSRRIHAVVFKIDGELTAWSNDATRLNQILWIWLFQCCHNYLKKENLPTWQFPPVCQCGGYYTAKYLWFISENDLPISNSGQSHYIVKPDTCQQLPLCFTNFSRQKSKRARMQQTALFNH